MGDGKAMQMALFRYGVISELLRHDDERSLKKRLLERAGREWVLPDGRLREFSSGTIEGWLYRYRRHGLAGLEDGGRKDKGAFRRLSGEVGSRIASLLVDNPGLRTSAVIGVLSKDVDLEMPSASTIYRFARVARPPSGAPSGERRSFEAPHAGSLWQTDIMYGPYLPRLNERGRWAKNQTFLVAILDDHSRLLCHGEFHWAQDLLSYLSCLRSAVRKRGVPERLYCDNGKVFLSEQVKMIMAELGSSVIHTKIRDCEAKGKIERFFLTVRQSFLEPALALDPPKGLDELNRGFWKWAEESYNLKRHSSTGMTPVERWMASSHRVRLAPPDLDGTAFRFRTTRKVRKDGTISLNGGMYETCWTLAGKKVDVSYDPFAPDRPFVSHEGKSYGRASALDRAFNNKLPGRKKQEA